MSMAGTLYIIATPIGNLDDVSARALDALKNLDLLLCEDTRVTRRLLERYGIVVPFDSYREEVHAQKLARAVAALQAGKKVGLVSDAGTPAISDPGFRLVRDALAAMPDLTVVPIPGPSASVAALSICGFPADEFLFLGFPPHKKGRAAFFDEAMKQPRTVALYESPHRIDKTLDAVEALDPTRQLCLCRELTKFHETIYRGTPAEVKAKLAATSSKGEFVLVIAPKE